MDTQIKILIVEHDPNDIELIQYELKKDGINYLSEITQNEEEYRNALKNFVPDIILSDYKLPSFHGLVAFEIKEKISPLTPLIIVSGTIGEENSIELIKNGLTDFVLKDKLYSLPTKVERALKEAKANRQKIKAEEKLASEYKEKEKQLAAIIIANSDLKKAEKKTSRANRLYYITSQINQLIVHTTDEKTLFEETCNIAIDLGKFRMAWIGIIDEKTKNVIPVAHAGEEHGYLSKLKTISVDDVTEGRGPAGTAYREGKYSVCNDIENNPKMAPWKKEALSHGYYSSIGLPIKKFGKVIGVFNLYASEPNFFNDREIALLDEITGDISFALDNFEKEKLRKKAEAALTEKEFFLRESQKAGHIGSYKTNFITGYWQSSETLDDIFGIDKNHIRSIEGWKEIVHPEDQNAMDEYLRLEVIGKQKSFDREYRIVKINDKQTRWVYGIGDVKFDDTGNITEMIGTIQDITERKNSEAALRESEETFHRLFNESADPILLLDDTGFTDCNQSAVSILGYSSRQEVLNKKPWDISSEKQPDGRLSSEKAKEMIAKAARQGYNRFEWVHTKVDGTEFPVEVMLTAITLKGKQYFYTLWRDITERKIAEQSLNDLSARLLLATNSAGIGIFDWDIQKDILLWDNNMYKIFGVSPDKFNGAFEAWSNTVHPDDLQNSLAEVQAAIDGTKDFHTFFRILWAGTEVRFIEGNAIIMRDGNGKAYRMIGVNRDITEQKKAEETIIKERDLSDSIINSLPGIFYLVDEMGKNLRWNKNFEIVSGYSAAEISQLHPLDLFDVDEKQLLGEKIEEVFKSGRADVEASFFTKTKEKIPYYFNGWRVNYEGKPCLIGVGIDITERKRSEEALRITQFAFDNAGDSIYWMTPDSRIVNVNEAASNALGYTRQELLELSVPDIDPNYNEEVWSMFFPELREKGSLFFETIQQAKDGRLIPVEIRANYIKFGNKELSCAFVRDITERKKAEVQLSKSESRFRHLMDAIPDALLGTNKEGKIVYANLQARILFGYSTDELLNNKLEILLPERFRSRHSRHREDYHTNPLSREMGEVGMPLYGRRKDGSEFATEISLSRIETEEGLVVLSAIRDITEKKKAEENLNIYAAELAASNTELEQFAYVASHDLEEPLRMISSFLNLLEKRINGQLDDTSRQYIDFAVDGAEQMKKLIKAILEYSRVGANKEDFAPVDLNEVVKYVIKVLEQNIKKNTSLITFKLLPVITANETLITHLFLNLVNNALKYHSDKEPVIEIGSIENPEKYIIYVKDNGIGIDPKFSDKIFVIFQRLHTRKEYSGTGIGLAICKRISEIHNGKIWVESEVGKGSTFYFSIPKNIR